MLQSIKEVIKLYSNKKISRAAAQLSYCLTLSIFPLLICINAMLAGFDLSEQDILTAGEGIIPASTLNVISDYIEYVSANLSPTMLAGALALMATTSSASFRALLLIMSEIQGIEQHKGLWNAVLSFVYSIAFIAVIYLSIIIIVTGDWFLRTLSALSGIVIGWAWIWLRFILLYLLLLSVIYAIYRITAPKSRPKNQRIIGAVLATTAIVTVSLFFSWTIDVSAKYSIVYGSINSFVILMLWLFIIGNVLISGNIVNLVFNREHK